MLKATAIRLPKKFSKVKIKPKTDVDFGRYDYWLLAVVALLLLLGTVMVYSASFVTASQSKEAGYNPSYYLWRHLIWLGLGLGGMVVVMRIDYHKWRRYSIAAMITVLILLLAILVLPASLAPSLLGAKRWIAIGGQTLQPSELAKIALILYAAHWLSSKGDKVRNFYYGMVPFALILGFVIALVMGEPDLGTSLIIGFIGMAMFFVAGANMFHLLVAAGTAAGGFALLAVTAAYRLNRLQAFMHPFADTNGSNWHIQQALMGIGSGGIFGRGLGMSQQKFFWLPTVFTDSIFAVIGEELGLVGTTVVVILFLLFAWRGLRIAFHAPDGFGRLIAMGITIYVIAQAFLNIAVITSTVPFTGVPLPFISYGGSSLSVTLIALGLILNVSRQTVANPRILELEEIRQRERFQREIARQQRDEERARKQALREQEIERERREATELNKARFEWESKQRQERERARVQAEQEEQRRQRQLQQEQLRQQQEQYRHNQQMAARQAQAYQEAMQEDLPDMATTSYLAYQKRQPKMRVESIDQNRELEELTKPKSRKPRRDWAKAYNDAHKKHND